MARDATARLYDVDENKVAFLRPKKLGKYTHGTIRFQARKGKLIDLDKLHESVWATRLSKGTRSGLVALEVTAVGSLSVSNKQTRLDITGSNAHFILGKGKSKQQRLAFEQMTKALLQGNFRRTQTVRVTGTVEGWGGAWPSVLKKLPRKPRRIIVTGFQATP
jgi:hypothetical protein